jgi:hypothetical protein
MTHQQPCKSKKKPRKEEAKLERVVVELTTSNKKLQRVARGSIKVSK